jgi:hypothetical protein
VKRSLPLVCLLLCCSLLEGQSLVDLATKEKERRKANAAAGKKASIDAEGGGTRAPREEESNLGRPLTRPEAIAALQREWDRLREETDEAFRECGRAMKERGYEKISNNLPACAEARALSEKKYSAAQAIQDLKDGKSVN